MDNKRVFLAVGLSMIVLLAWSYFFAPKPSEQPVSTEQAQSETVSAPNSAESTTAQPASAPVAFVAQSGQSVTVDTPLYKAVFNSAGGILTSFELKNYRETIAADSKPVNLISQEAIGRGPLGLLWNGKGTWREAQWAAPTTSTLALSGEEAGSLTFTGQVNGLRITRTFKFEADSYFIDEKVNLLNTANVPQSGRLGFTVASETLTSKDDRYNQTRISYMTADGVDNEKDIDDLEQGLKFSDGVKWGAVQSNYFVLALAPQSGDLTLRANFQNGLYRVQADKDNLSIAPNTQANVQAGYYFGPVTDKYLADAPNQLGKIVTYGFFDILSKPLLTLLRFFHNYVGNWGVAIILLTILIKGVFWPLSHKSYKSMNSMKKIQPLMAKVREQYKDDRQKMNEEMMRLYKTYKVNPAGGCLPMLVQIPVFFGLYQALLGAIELRHAPFISHVPFTDIIWLADLSTKDPFYVTPVIMGLTMFLQQKMTPSPGDPTQAKIMLLMPVIFTFLFLNFPAGLVVYWLVNNVLSIAQQWMMLRKA